MDTESTGTQKEPLPEEGAPSTEGKESSGDKTVDIFTKGDVEKIRGDLLSVHGKEKKALERKASSFESELASTREELTSIREDADRRAYEAVKDDPTGFEAYKRDKGLKDREGVLKQDRAKLDQDKAEHADLFQASEKAALLLAVSDIATEIGVNKDSILRFKPQSPEDAREIAQAVKDLGGTPGGVKTPDSGIGSGAGPNWDKMSAEEKIAYAVAHPKKTS